MTVDIPEPESRINSVRSQWTLALRAEVLRVGGGDIARVAHVGMWLASFADADGGRAFPGIETLAALTGYSQDSVRDLLKVLLGVEMLSRRKRPNQTAVYQLVVPLPRPDWAAHMHHVTDTPKRRAYLKKKAAQVAAAIAKEAAAQERNPPTGGFRNPPTAVVPEPADAGGSGTPASTPEPADGTPRNPPVGGFRNPPTAGGTCTQPPTGVTPTPDTTRFGPRPQPPDARANPTLRLAASSPGPAAPASVQPPLLISAPTEPPPGLPEPDTPLRCSGCGYPRGWRPDDITLCAHCRTRQLDTG